MAEDKKFGYVRVSSKEQNLDRQIEAMLKYGISKENILVDKKSGKDMNRIQYQALKDRLRKGDTLVIKSIDRLSRNYENLKNEWNDLVNNRGVNIEVIDMPILNTTNKDNVLMGKVVTDIVLTLLGYVAEQEKDFIKKRQKEGIAIAKAKGKYAKPRIEAPEGFEELFKKASNGEMAHTKAMEQLGLKKTTYYKLANELGLSTDKSLQIKLVNDVKRKVGK